MKEPIMPRPVARLERETAYSPGRPSCPIDLRLDGNEGRTPPAGLLGDLAAAGPGILRRYPDRGDLEAALASRAGFQAASVLVTAGADDALDRLCRTYLEKGRNLVVATPTFEMIPRYARLAGAEVRATPWPREAFPVEAVLDLADEDTGIIAVVTPNNPTGQMATAQELRRLSAGAPGALLLVDLAYGEFADENLMPVVRDLPNAVAVRSLSKAWGLAGLRVGWAAGPEELIQPLRAAGGPYAVAGPSLAAVRASLDDDRGVEDFVAVIRDERERLAGDLAALGARPVPSQGNFVYAEFDDPAWVRDGLAGLGISVRLLAQEPGPGPLRITCPGNGPDFARLGQGLDIVLAPEALLFDMDGVLADVSSSYRRTILETAASFGETFTPEDVAEAKRLPGSNNDWLLTQGLLATREVAVALEVVIDRFQEIYLGLADQERLIPERAVLERLADRLPLAVVTGRPCGDARLFLERLGLTELFTSVVCLEDGPGKPDPGPVNLVLASMGVTRAWMVGDTVNDVLAARASGVLPLGVVPPGEDPSSYADLLRRSGAGRVLTTLSELEEVLPS